MADSEKRHKEKEAAETKEEKAPAQEEIEVVEEEGAVEEQVEEGAEELAEVDRLQNALEEAQAQADEYLDGWRRSQAEFANYKKRQRIEQAKGRELANANLLRKLLPVLDDFERAIATLPPGLGTLSWTQGLLMVMRKLEAVLETEGTEAIETEGKSFDPYYHEAVTHEELPGYEEGEIIGEIQRGYVLGDRVLRPALVRVAKATKPAPEDESSEEQAGEEAEDSQASEE